MEREGNWIPLTPGKPISGMSADNCESVLTSDQGTEIENINGKFPFMGAFDTMETIAVTPAKPIPGRSGQSCETVLISEQVTEKENIRGQLPCMLNEMCEFTADINNGHESEIDFTSTAATQYGTSSVQEEAVRIPTSECGDSKKAHSGDKSPVDKGSIPTPFKTKESMKRRNDGIDMNKKAKQRRRMKKHRPKVYDDSLPKKAPKAQTPRRSIPKPRPPKTPKPATPNRVQEKRNNFNKNKSSSMQSSTTCGFGDVVQDIEEVSTPSIITADSCKRSLNFDDHIAKESNLVSKPHEEEPPRLETVVGDLYNFGTIVTSKRNTPRRSRQILPLPQDKPESKVPYDDDDFFYCHEENFLQIPECLPLQEVPVVRIESFTSIYSDFLRVDNLKWFGLRELREVPVIESRSLVPSNEETSDTDEGLISLDKKTIKILTGKLASLDLNYRCKELMVLENNVNGALVKKLNPKVDLDNESLRVWKLLMENDGSEPVEEMDKDREEWWETQRNIFRGRVDSFIAKMHLIQGNRRFSPWKASQESVASNTKICEGFSQNNEREQDLDLCISLPDQKPQIDWEEFRKSYCEIREREVNENHMDAVDWDAVRLGTREELAKIIVERGMNNRLAGRIKDFLDRMHKEHGSHDLEWLRDVPPDKAKEFLLSIKGLGLKSVECVRLLTLHHPAFPVDTNVARVATRLGWVPLQSLPGQVPIHLLNAYPEMDTIQKYLFPRLCTLDQKTLYELHYQLITFGKVFCTKAKPNCDACPMRAECRHYASAFASRRLAICGSKESGTVT
nr:protein ROS1-like [Tanacetum cinerariifolium]